MKEILPYGTWTSPVDTEALFSSAAEPAHPFLHGGRLFWLESLVDEGGRTALMTMQSGAPRCLTPSPFNIRSRVHEYGGRCFCVLGDSIVFNHFDDGRLYRQSLDPDNNRDSRPEVVVTAGDDCCGFADLVSCGHTVIAVMEQSVAGAENRNTLVAIDVLNGAAQPVVLAGGADFYAAPAMNRSGTRIAWLEWDHPYMPWDCTRLLQADLSLPHTPRLRHRRMIVDDVNTAVSQPGFIDDDRLVFAMDSSEGDDWSNLFMTGGSGLERLTREQGEFGEAHWVFGNRRWAQVSPTELLAVCTSHEGDRLLRVDLARLQEPVCCLEAPVIGQLSPAGEGCVMVAASEDRQPRILRLEAPFATPSQPLASPHPLFADGYSEPASLHCLSPEGEDVWAYRYPPFHPDLSGPRDQAPPLVVMVHGGPTSRTSPAFHPLRQYFASLGFAVLDVNHRGSTGYGRRFRQRLLGGWGEIDVEDIVSCVDRMVALGLADPSAVFIRGGSAGGYAVLRALTEYPDRFAGGACYYGIGNLATLAEITHKFESRYADRLVGETYDPERASNPSSRFYTRSPVNSLDRLHSPLVLFQGEEDRVVPPAVSREVVAILAKRGITHAYHEYPGEGHGFRSKAVRIDSLTRETDFFRQIILDPSRRESA